MKEEPPSRGRMMTLPEALISSPLIVAFLYAILQALNGAILLIT